MKTKKRLQGFEIRVFDEFKQPVTRVKITDKKKKKNFLDYLEEKFG